MSIANHAPRRLGHLLLERGYVTPDAIERALAIQQEQRGTQTRLLGEILVELDFCTEDQVVECLAEEIGVPYAHLEARLFDPAIVDVLPRDTIEEHLVLPLFKVRDTLTVAVAEPSNVFLIDELRSMTGLNVQIVAATSKDVRRMITELPNSKIFVIDDIIEDSESSTLR